MTWIKLDDGLPEHRKIVLAGSAAGWLYVCGLCYCSRQLSDGRIPKPMVDRLTDAATARSVGRLVDQGLWVDDGASYTVHDYQLYQRSAEQIEADRASDRRRKRPVSGSNGVDGHGSVP